MYLALQLPTGEHGRQDRAGARSGLHRGDEASATRSARRARTRRDHARSRVSRRRGQCHHIVAARTFGCAHRNTRRRHGQLHRVHRRRRTNLRSGRAHDEASAPRTGRQRCRPGVVRCQPRCRSWCHCQRVVVPQRSNLHRSHPRHRARQPLRRIGVTPGCIRPESQGGRPHRRRHAGGAGHLGCAARSHRVLYRHRRNRGRRNRDRWPSPVAHGTRVLRGPHPAGRL